MIFDEIWWSSNKLDEVGCNFYPSQNSKKSYKIYYFYEIDEFWHFDEFWWNLMSIDEVDEIQWNLKNFDVIRWNLIDPIPLQRIVGLELCWVVVSFAWWGNLQNFRPLGSFFLVKVEFLWVGWGGGCKVIIVSNPNVGIGVLTIFMLMIFVKIQLVT